MTTDGSPHPRALAEAGYRGYGDWVDWTNHAGGVMPAWRELPELQRAGWVAAAGAIRQALLTCAQDAERGRSAYEASHPMISERSGASSTAEENSNSGGRA